MELLLDETNFVIEGILDLHPLNFKPVAAPSACCPALVRKVA